MVALDNNRTLAYSLIWVQCSNITRVKVEAKYKFVEVSSGLDVLSLLNFIK